MSQFTTGGIIVGCLVVAFLLTLSRRELAFAALACVIGGVLAYSHPDRPSGAEPDRTAAPQSFDSVLR